MKLHYTGSSGKEVSILLPPHIICNYVISGDFLMISFHTTLTDKKVGDYKWSWCSTISSIQNYNDVLRFLNECEKSEVYKTYQENLKTSDKKITIPKIKKTKLNIQPKLEL